MSEFRKNSDPNRDPVLVYVLTQNSKSDHIFNVMESEHFYNYGGAFLFNQDWRPSA